MTIGIAGPGRKVPGQNAVVGFTIAAVVVVICLILLKLASDFLVDWLWFSSIGYLQVFLTTIVAKAAVFFAVLTATAVILWLNGLLAGSLARSAGRRGRSRQLGHLPAVSLSGTLWRGGSALQQGHRLLSLLAAR